MNQVYSMDKIGMQHPHEHSEGAKVSDSEKFQQYTGEIKSLARIIRYLFVVIGLGFFASRVVDVLVGGEPLTMKAVLVLVLVSFIIPIIVWTAARRGEGMVRKLESAMQELRILKGFLPICASCKKIRDDEGYWNEIERYVNQYAGTEFSHGICPDCAKVLYAGYLQDERKAS